MSIPAIGATLPLGVTPSATTAATATTGAAAGTTQAAAVTGPAAPVAPTGPAAVTAASAAPGSFEASLTAAVNSLQSLQTSSDVANIQAVTSGNLDDIQQATIAAAEVQTSVQLASTVRNQAVDAFNQIMQMGS